MQNKRNPYKGLNGRLNVTGKNINYIRTSKNISAQNLSDKLMIIGLDIHRQAIYDIESGRRTVADYELCAIADVLGVSTDLLLEDFLNYVKKEKE